MLVGHRTKVGTTLMRGKTKGRLTGTHERINPPGKPLEGNSSEEEEVVPPLSHPNQPRASSRINDNYCVAKLQTRLLAGSIPQTINTGLNLNVKLPVASHVHSAPGHSQKRELSLGSAGCHYKSCKLKSVKSVSCVTQLSCVLPVTNVKNAAPNLPVGARLFDNCAGSGSRSESSSDPKRELHPPLPDPAKTHKVTHGCKLLCQSPQEQLPAGGITSAYSQECCRTSKTTDISGVFQPTIFCPKTQQQVETYTRFEQTKYFPQNGEIQDGDTGNHQNVSPTRGVGYLNRFQGHLLPYTSISTTTFSSIWPKGLSQPSPSWICQLHLIPLTTPFS